MSLFPAYSETVLIPENEDENKKAEKRDNWLSNPSYVSQQPSEITEIKDDSTDVEIVPDPQIDVIKKSKKHKKKTKVKDVKIPVVETPDFDDITDYYLDKKPERSFLSVTTLHKPACPRYLRCSKILGTFTKRRKISRTTVKRYFNEKKINKIKSNEENNINCKNTDEMDKILEKTKYYNINLARNPYDTNLWIEFINFQDISNKKLPKTQLAERKTNILDEALKTNPKNNKLLSFYVNVIDVYPIFEVSKILEKLLINDTTSYVLRNAQIMATQGSMARCNVPDVLKLYEKCMQIMYKHLDDDIIMLKLFTSCALFLRQSSLYEQFFALIKLALELNISLNKFTNITGNDFNQNTLIEYEEIVLKSGLPMNEIWLRIEKLRQNFNFLPCDVSSSGKCNDPQRIVFNEDVLHYIYPLKNNDNKFKLILIILKMLKIPLPINNFNKFITFTMDNSCTAYEFDCIEELLTILLPPIQVQQGEFSSITNEEIFNEILFNLINELTISPTYINKKNIGYEIYLNKIIEILLQLSECFTDNDKKRVIFLLIWLKLEEIIFINYLNNNTSDDELNLKKKSLKNKIKNLLKKEENRNILNFYTEYAIIEFMFNNTIVAENIFYTAIQQVFNADNNYGGTDINDKADIIYAFTTFIHILIKKNNYKQAKYLLTCFLLKETPVQSENYDEFFVKNTPTVINAAYQNFKQLITGVTDEETLVKNFQLEHFFLPNYLIELIKMEIIFNYFFTTKINCLIVVENLLKQFSGDDENLYYYFLCEKFYEIITDLMQFEDITDGNTEERKKSSINTLVFDLIKRGLETYPDNLKLLKMCACLEGQPWLKIRTLLTSLNTPMAYIFLIIAARYRAKKYHNSLQSINKNKEQNYYHTNIDGNETVFQLRIINLLKYATDKTKTTRKNSLLWRLYLKAIYNIENNVEKCSSVLFTALDECPWNKALYLDGVVYVPQETPHLQDLIIEKQLRIYALPEELEILRQD